MPFFTAKEEEIQRVKEAVAKRDLSILQTAKERFICFGYSMKFAPDFAALIKQENRKSLLSQPPDIVAVAQEIFASP